MTTLLPPNVKVHLALGFIDMRNYVERRIMQSAEESRLLVKAISEGKRQEASHRVQRIDALSRFAQHHIRIQNRLPDH
jgi:hypothetical protein